MADVTDQVPAMSGPISVRLPGRPLDFLDFGGLVEALDWTLEAFGQGSAGTAVLDQTTGSWRSVRVIHLRAGELLVLGAGMASNNDVQAVVDLLPSRGHQQCRQLLPPEFSRGLQFVAPVQIFQFANLPPVAEILNDGRLLQIQMQLRYRLQPLRAKVLPQRLKRLQR